MAAADMLQSLVDRAAAATKLTRKEVRAGKTLQSIVERSAAAVTLRPAIGQGTDATTVRLRDGTTCDIEEGPWQMIADLPSELGGSDEHPGAAFLLRAAMGTCFVQTAALWSAKLDVPIDRLEVEVVNDFDAQAEYLDSIAPYRNGDGYAIPGEFVVTSGQKQHESSAIASTKEGTS